jgi:hypothetical protein
MDSPVITGESDIVLDIQSEISTTPSLCCDYSSSSLSEIPQKNERIKKYHMTFSLPDFVVPMLTGEDTTICSIRTSRYMKIRQLDPTALPPPPRKFRPTSSSTSFSRSRSAGIYCDVDPIDPTTFSHTIASKSEGSAASSDSVAECNELLPNDDLDTLGTFSVASFQIADRDFDPPQQQCLASS